MWNLEAGDKKTANTVNFRLVLMYRMNLYKKMNLGAKLCVLKNRSPNQEAVIPLVDRMLSDT